LSRPFTIKNNFEIAGSLFADSLKVGDSVPSDPIGQPFRTSGDAETEGQFAGFGSLIIGPDPFAFDIDALAYITSVETADGEDLEAGVKTAINDFVVGCKSDGIWDALKASCILAGARTLNGALVPLVGTAPTNFNFVSADYNRKTGLVGNGSTKYLNSNRLDNADPQDNAHISIFVSSAGNADSAYAGGGRASGGINNIRAFQRLASFNGIISYNRNATATNPIALLNATGFMGNSRLVGSEFIGRGEGQSQTIVFDSTSPVATSIAIFARILISTPSFYSNARLSFYSIGESLDLAALDTRVSALMTAIDGAIT
jgi:hypothetical protein